MMSKNGVDLDHKGLAIACPSDTLGLGNRTRELQPLPVECWQGLFTTSRIALLAAEASASELASELLPTIG